MRISISLIIAFTCVFALILPCVLGKDIYLSPNGVGTSRWRLIARYSDLLIGDIAGPRMGTYFTIVSI
jgi:hypothetical protein